MVYYLKVNVNTATSLFNLKRWLEVIQLGDENIPVLVCDDPVLLKNIIEKGLIVPGMRFISSERECAEINEIADEITNTRWRNAGVAHLTTFWDAKQNGYEKFWNIDADDTVFCASPQKTAEILKAVEIDAENNGVHMYSLDMHTTRTDGMHWSFGITYTDNRIDWFAEMKNYFSRGWYEVREVIGRTNQLINIDMFFTYVRNVSDTVRLETFYPENMYFIHYSKDFLTLCIYSGVYYWHEGKLYSPILKDVIKLEGFAEGEPIAKDVKKFDLGIALEESVLCFQKFVAETLCTDLPIAPVKKTESPWAEIDTVLQKVKGEK